MDLVHVVSLLGGIAFFLYGMSAMGNGLKRVAGAKMESYLWHLSSTPLKGFLLGTLAAAVIQSSGATSVMVVSFVNAGMMKLAQAVPIILGSNIGTTMTGWLLTLSSRSGDGVLAQLFSTTVLVSVFALIGILMQMIGKKNASKSVGLIFLGLGTLLLAMTLISDAVSPLKESEAFRSLLVLFENPLLGILAGILVAAVVQSASAAVGIVQAICVTGALSYSAVFPIIVGINIGASVPVLFSMLGSTKDGKRASLSYLTSNILSGVLAYLYFIPLSLFWPELFAGSATILGVAMLNTGLRVVTLPILLPMHRVLEKISYRLIPRTGDETVDTEEIDSLSESLLNYAPVALERASAAANKMSELAHQNIKRAISLISWYDKAAFNSVQERERVIDKYEDKIGNFVVKIGKNELNANQQALVSELLSAVGDFERLSDHAVNLSEVAQELQEKKLSFSDSAKNEIDYLVQAVLEILDLAMSAFTQQIPEIAQKIEPLEEVIDEMCKHMRARHIERLQNDDCTIITGFVFSDLLNNLERVADHCSNIAFCVSHRANLNEEEHEFTESLATSESFREYFEQYREKYLAPIE